MDPGPRASEPSDAPAEPRPLTLHGADGLELRAWQLGSGPDCALFLHGLGDHARVWDPVLSALPAAVRAVALDWRGHGESAWSPAADYARATLAADLSRVIDACAAERLVLVGHSLGGSLAIQYAARHPGRVHALAILDVGPRIARVAVKRLADGLRLESLRFRDMAHYRKHLRNRYWLAQPHALARFAEYAARATESGTVIPRLDPATQQILHERGTRRDMWAELASISCPTLVIRGGISAVLARETAERMVHEALPQGSLIEIARAGHALLLDHPQRVRNALAGFLAETLPPRAPCEPTLR